MHKDRSFRFYHPCFLIFLILCLGGCDGDNSAKEHNDDTIESLKSDVSRLQSDLKELSIKMDKRILEENFNEICKQYWALRGHPGYVFATVYAYSGSLPQVGGVCRKSLDFEGIEDVSVSEAQRTLKLLKDYLED